ncbi:MAG: FAD-dependent oxidoreductase [Anaerolineae bacterium]
MTKRIVIVGGVATGTKAAARARRCDADAEIILIEKGELISYAACALPYYVSGVIEDPAELVVARSDDFALLRAIDVRTRTEAMAIDRERRRLTVKDLASGRIEEVPYDALVLATGANPVVPPLPGRDLAGVFLLKEPADALNIRAEIDRGRVERAVIIGGGLIGMEMAEALVARGVRVAIVEMLDRVLAAFLDRDMAAVLHAYLRQQGVELYLGERAERFEGDAGGHVRRVVTAARELPADLVLLAIGVRPEVTLAREAGLALGSTGAIVVDDHLRTSDPAIYAGGDCVESLHRVTGQRVYAPLGSTANKHGRVIGTNVAGGDATFPGVLGTMVAKVFDYTVGATGIGPARARDLGLEPLTALVAVQDRAHNYPTRQEIVLKAVGDRATSRLLGLQGVGPGEVAKRIDVAAAALSGGASVDQLAELDLGYAPPYAPAVDPLHHVANLWRNKRDGLTRAVGPVELQEMLEEGESFVLLDVRTR